ncbi:MAG: hypothetical protein GYA51_03675 [Candidatus Methanofastidiosa archaeon]|jgi:Ca2+-dependent lipid-binding protein|nr:hypothetical protein [Candidatus Methanofastidiosa archaeon]
MKAQKIYENILKPKSGDEVTQALITKYNNMDPEIFNFLNDLDYKFVNSEKLVFKAEKEATLTLYVLNFYKPIAGKTLRVLLTDTLNDVKKKVYRQL